MPAFNAILSARLEKQAENGLLRTLTPCASDAFGMVNVGAQNLINFSSNDYLGLSFHPAVIEAGIAASKHAGAGSGASRLVTGNHPYYAPLEQGLAQAKKQESALVFGSGYLANIGTISALMGKDDLILADKLAHACILDGARLSGATLKRFSHNDVKHARQLLEIHRGKYAQCLIVTESIFSMDGDVAPLDALSQLATQHDAWLMVDDAHGFDYPMSDGIKPHVDIWLGTLSKALGSYGGYVAGSKILIDYLISSARSFIFSTGLPPFAIASAHAAIEMACREPERKSRALAHAQRFSHAMRLEQAQSAIVPLIVGSAQDALQLSSVLKEKGVYVQAIRPPTVPPNSSRLRITFSAAHSDGQVDTLIDSLRALGR